MGYLDNTGLTHLWGKIKSYVTTAISGKADTSSLRTVATSGKYSDLSGKPTIPSAVTDSTVSGWGYIKSVPTASATVLGGVKVGSGLSISNGVLSASGSGSTVTYSFDSSTGVLTITAVASSQNITMAMNGDQLDITATL